jgi:hypothetical protein
MKIKWDITEWMDFGERLASVAKFEEQMEKATQEIAKKLHTMLIRNTPVDTGTLSAFWQTGENYAYTVQQLKSGFKVTLTNTATYALSVNDGHYSHNQYNKGGTPYVVKNRTPKLYSVDGAMTDETFVFGHFFVEKSIVETEDKLEKIIRPMLEAWWRWCCGGK